MDHRHGLPVRYIFSLSLSLSLSLFYSILFSTNLALSVFLFLPFFVPLSAYLPTRLPCLSVSLSVCLFRLNANVISHSLLYFNVLVPFSSPISFYVYLFLLFFNCNNRRVFSFCSFFFFKTVENRNRCSFYNLYSEGKFKEATYFIFFHCYFYHVVWILPFNGEGPIITKTLRKKWEWDCFKCSHGLLCFARNVVLNVSVLQYLKAPCIQ